MTEQITEAFASSLEQVAKHFETWRKTSRTRQPIPEHLWKSAVELSSFYPASRIAKTLRLDYAKLKSRIEDADTRRKSDLEFPPSFIELDLGTSDKTTDECILEVKSSNGSQLKMHWKGSRSFDPLEVCKAFWEGCL